MFPLNLIDRCEGVSCKAWEKCVYDSRYGVSCVCRDNLECPADFQPVCGSDANSYNNYCIMKATVCRQGKEIDKTADGPCTPGMPALVAAAVVLLFRFFFFLIFLSVSRSVRLFVYSFCLVVLLFVFDVFFFSYSALVFQCFLSSVAHCSSTICFHFSFASFHRSNLSNRSIQQLQGVF